MHTPLSTIAGDQRVVCSSQAVKYKFSKIMKIYSTSQGNLALLTVLASFPE